MFDPKSLLDALVRGNAQQSPGASSGGGLEDLLRNFLPNAGADASRSGSPQTTNLQPEQGSSGNPLGDLLSKLQQGGQGGGGLGDILGKLQQQAGGAGGIADILGQVFGQAKSGVREGAGRIDQATGASDRMRDAVGQLTGPLARRAGGAAQGADGQQPDGGGRRTRRPGRADPRHGRRTLTGRQRHQAGRPRPDRRPRLQGLQNYQQGVPPLTGGKAAAPAQALLAAPSGSGFEAEASTGEHATILIRAMIAAAAADGRIDAAEQKKILGSFGKSDLDAAARQFLARELEKPATVEELASACSSPRRRPRSIPPRASAWIVDSDEEHEFLAALAEALGIDDDLAAHIDAAARTAA